MITSNKPMVLMCVTPMAGHFEPLHIIAKDLVTRGYDVTFLTGSAYRASVEKLGADFVPLTGRANFSDQTLDEHFPERKSLPEGPPRIVYDIKELLVTPIPFQHESIQSFLRDAKARNPSRPIVLMADTGFLGALPSILGAPGLRPSGTITVGVCPLFLSGMRSPLPPNIQKEECERSHATTEVAPETMLVQTQNRFLEILRVLGAATTSNFLSDAAIYLPDRYLQLSIPGAEYPCSDLPPNLRWTGGLPRHDHDKGTLQPPWWDDVALNPKKKRVIAVAQGTLSLHYEDLIIPTMLALRNRQDYLVIVLLGKLGATLPAETFIPENARVADFVPYNSLFPHSDMFVTNGGYGGFQQAISHGMPVVIAGLGQDKPEVAARAERSGMGVNLNTGTPTQEAVREAVDKVLSNVKYKERALELQAETRAYDPFAVIAENIDEVARGHKVQ